MKAVLLFGDEIDRNALIESGLYLKENYGFKIQPYYISDIKKSEMIPYTGTGVIIDDTSSLTLNQWEEFQSDEIRALKTLLIKKGISEKLEVSIGIIPDIVNDIMKENDLLLFGKGEVLSDNQITMLKNLFKPIILVGNKTIKFEKIMIANDDGMRVNKSCYNFMNLFTDVEKFTTVTLGLELDENHLLNYLKSRNKNVENIFIKSTEEKKFKEEYTNEFSLVITGKIKRSYFFEKIIKKKGIALIENPDSAVFIG
jgi:hypothetical protein